MGRSMLCEVAGADDDLVSWLAELAQTDRAHYLEICTVLRVLMYESSETPTKST